MKSIFVSHVFEDSKWLKNIKKWENNLEMKGFTFTFEEQDKRIQGKKNIKNFLKQKIKGAAVIVVLIGDDTHNHDWIRVEVELANNFNKKIICMRVPETTGAAPKILSNYDIVDFNPNQITSKWKRT